MNGSQTISERFADYVTGLRYDDIPPPVIEKAKQLLAHHLGVALGARTTDRGRRAVSLALDLTGATGRCSVIGESRGADLLEAVFANAFLMTGLDDILPTGVGRSVGVHPGAMVQPAAWTVGEATKASGRELLVAVVVGYDLIGRIGREVQTWEVDVPRNKSHIVGPLGAAAAASRLFRLSPSQTTYALGHAGQAAMGIAEGTGHLWNMYALLARNGVMAAMLAKRDFPASRTIVEGRHGIYRSFFFRDVPSSARESLAALGSEYEITDAQTKHQLASGSNLIPLELTQHLVTELSLKPSDVALVDVVLPEERQTREAIREAALISHEDVATSQTQSLRFRIAMIVTHGRTDPVRMETPPDAELSKVLDRIALRFEANHPTRYVRVEITTANGQRHVRECDHYEPPAVDEYVCLSDSGRPLLSERRLATLVEQIRNLDTVADTSRIMANTTASTDVM